MSDSLQFFVLHRVCFFITASLSLRRSVRVDARRVSELRHMMDWRTHGIRGKKVICKSMGFVGAQKFGSTNDCSTFDGRNFCGGASPLVSEVGCAGDESEIMSCPHEAGSDVAWLCSKLPFPSC